MWKELHQITCLGKYAYLISSKYENKIEPMKILPVKSLIISVQEFFNVTSFQQMQK